MEYASSKGAVQVIDGHNQVLNWVSEWVSEWVSARVSEWVSVLPACHAKGSCSRRLCVLRLPRERQPAAPAATTRAAAPPGGSVYCACHEKGSLSGDHTHRSSSKRLCVLRLPRERQPQPQRQPRAPQLLQEALCTALCTAPATRKVNHRGLGYNVVPVTFAM